MKPSVFFTGKASFFLYRKQMKRKSATKSTLILLVTIKIKVIKLVSEVNSVHHRLLLFSNYGVSLSPKSRFVKGFWQFYKTFCSIIFFTSAISRCTLCDSSSTEENLVSGRINLRNSTLNFCP